MPQEHSIFRYELQYYHDQENMRKDLDELSEKGWKIHSFQYFHQDIQGSYRSPYAICLLIRDK